MANATIGLVVKRQTLPPQPKSERSEEGGVNRGVLNPLSSMWGKVFFFSFRYLVLKHLPHRLYEDEGGRISEIVEKGDRPEGFLARLSRWGLRLLHVVWIRMPNAYITREKRLRCLGLSSVRSDVGLWDSVQTSRRGLPLGPKNITSSFLARVSGTDAVS